MGSTNKLNLLSQHPVSSSLSHQPAVVALRAGLNILHLARPAAVAPPAASGALCLGAALGSGRSPTPEQRRHLLLALGGGKVVQHWIQTAAEAAHTHGEQVGLVGAAAAAGRVGQLDVVHHQEDVGGGEADHKHHQHHRGHHHRSGLPEAVLHVGRRQSLNNTDVADGGDDERDEEEHGGVDGEEVPIVRLQSLHVLHIVAGGDAQVGQMEGLPGDEERGDAPEGQQPHGGTRGGGRLRAAPRQGVHGVDHRQEAVDADARHEQHGAVHVAVERRGDDPAHGGAVDPVVAEVVVGALEGKQEAEQQVGAGQVQHVDHRRLPGTDAVREHHHGDEVEGHADDEDEGVNGRDEARRQAAPEEIFGVLRDVIVLLGKAERAVLFHPRGGPLVGQVDVFEGLVCDGFNVTRESPEEGHRAWRETRKRISDHTLPRDAFFAVVHSPRTDCAAAAAVSSLFKGFSYSFYLSSNAV